VEGGQIEAEEDKNCKQEKQVHERFDEGDIGKGPSPSGKKLNNPPMGGGQDYAESGENDESVTRRKKRQFGAIQGNAKVSNAAEGSIPSRVVFFWFFFFFFLQNQKATNPTPPPTPPPRPVSVGLGWIGFDFD